MPKWIHERAKHLLATNPDMEKGTAFAVATQQAHKLGKTPKGFGTKEGKREAKAKFDKPKKEYVKGANPGELETPKLAAMREELEKEALSPSAAKVLAGIGLGATGGAAAGAAGAGEGSRLKGALKGSLVGGALGAGAGWAGPRYAAGRAGGLTGPQALGSLVEDAAAQTSGAARRVSQRLSKRAPAAAAKPKPNLGFPAVDPAATGAFSPQALKAASVLDPKQLQAMRDALGDIEVPSQTKNIERVMKFVDSLREKKAMIPGAGAFASTVQKGLMNPAKKLQQSQLIGVPKMEQPKVAPLNIKVGFATSQYSGSLGEGRFTNYASHIPPFVSPPVKTAGPPSEEKAKKTKMAAMVDELAKLNAVNSPASQLAKAQKIGGPKVTAPPGPSIQMVAKPVGYGRPTAAAIKPSRGV